MTSLRGATELGGVFDVPI